jgi:hypothetical protein
MVVKKSLGAETPPIVISGRPEGPGPEPVNTDFPLVLINDSSSGDIGAAIAR